MTPKFLVMHRYTGRTLIGPLDVLYVNPRRIDYFKPMSRPTQQPTIDCGTYVALGSRQHIIVRESVDELAKMLKR